jgi:hypothetical protein
MQFEGPGASYSVLAIDPGDRVLAIWRESTVYVAYLAGEQWQPFIGSGAVATPDSGGTLPHLALSREGLPVVAWEYFTAESGVSIRSARAVLR